MSEVSIFYGRRSKILQRVTAVNFILCIQVLCWLRRERERKEESLLCSRVTFFHSAALDFSLTGKKERRKEKREEEEGGKGKVVDKSDWTKFN